jgi:hypothetical protein
VKIVSHLIVNPKLWKVGVYRSTLVGFTLEKKQHRIDVMIGPFELVVSWGYMT